MSLHGPFDEWLLKQFTISITEIKAHGPQNLPLRILIYLSGTTITLGEYEIPILSTTLGDEICSRFFAHKQDCVL